MMWKTSFGGIALAIAVAGMPAHAAETITIGNFRVTCQNSCVVVQGANYPLVYDSGGGTVRMARVVSEPPIKE